MKRNDGSVQNEKIASSFIPVTPQKNCSSSSSSSDSNSIPGPSEPTVSKMATVSKEKMWNKVNKQNFINLLLEEKRQHKIACKNMRKADWIRIADALNLICGGTNFSPTQVQGKYNRMKMKFKEFRRCKEATGFEWDKSTNKVTASEAVWEYHLKKFPSHAKFRKKGVSNYDQLFEIFSNSFVTGEFSRSSTQVPNSPEKLDNIRVDTSQAGDETPTSHHPGGPAKRTFFPEHSDIETTSSKKQRDAELYYNMLASVIKSNEAYIASKTQPQNPPTVSAQPAQFSAAMCANALHNLRKVNGFPLKQFHLAIPFFKDEFWREMFMSWDDEERLYWVSSLGCPEQLT